MTPGTRLGPYEIGSALGAGGMGEVYRARDVKLGRDVALKILPQAFASDPDRLARFEREARTLAALNHPHIAQVYGFEDRALVMELVEGEDLSARIARGPIPLDEALPIARQIAEALEAAHDAGIIHRDLKPANIKVRGDGRVKVLDFGLAKSGATGASGAVGAQGAVRYSGAAGATGGSDPLNSPTITSPAALTMGGMILGTAAYMAPEQAKGKPVDKRADIWAFGCVLYEMVMARRPFDGEDITDTIAAVVSKEPDWSRVPATLTRLLQQCLQKDPRRRLRDIGDACALIDDAPHAAGAMPVSRGPLTLVLAGATAIAIIAAAALAYLHFGESVPAPPPITRLHMALPAGATPDLNMQISPDGRRLAYLGRGADGVVRVYLRAFDELDAMPIAGTEGTGSGSLFWSPDSRWLAFVSQLRLKKYDVVGGGSPQVIADVSGAPAIGGAWNRDGVIVIGSNPSGRAGSGGLFKVSATGGAISPITSLDPARKEMGHRFPSFLPDGRRFLYLRASFMPEQSAIFVGDIDGTPERQPSEPVVTTPAGPAVFFPAAGRESATAGQLLFYRASALMLQPFDPETLQLSGEPRSVAEPVGTFLDRGVFSASRTALVYTTAAGALDVQLRWYDGTDQTTGQPAGPPGAYTDLALSPDGTRAVVAVSELERATRRSLWMLDFARDTRTRLTFNAGRDRSPIWSADGRSIVYVSEIDGSTIARRQATGEGNDEVLVKSPQGETPSSLSQDGQFLAFWGPRPETRSPDLFVLPLAGPADRRKPYPLAATPLVEIDPQISPDGRWVAYVEADVAGGGRGGRPEVYVRPFAASAEALPNRTKWQVSSEGAGMPRWLAGGRQLSFVTGSEEERRIVVVDVLQTSDAARGAQAFQWGPPRPLLSMPKGTTIFALTGDGKRLLAATPVAANAAPRPLTVVLNWLHGVS
jgi:Tol biopolymer transport system component